MCVPGPKKTNKNTGAMELKIKIKYIKNIYYFPRNMILTCIREYLVAIMPKIIIFDFC